MLYKCVFTGVYFTVQLLSIPSRLCHYKSYGSITWYNAICLQIFNDLTLNSENYNYRLFKV